MKTYHSNRQVYQLIVIIAALILIPAALTYMNYRFSVQNPGGNDFLARWNGAHEWLKNGKNPYSDEVSVLTQKLIYGHPARIAKGEDLNQFVYPLYSMVFFAPFGLMDYNLARSIFMTILELSMLLICFVSLKLTGWKVKRLTLIGLMLFSIGWYCAIRAIILGQFSGLNALLILLGIWAIQQKQDVVGGILLILSTSKPQMSYLLVIYVVFWAFSTRRWSLILSMVGTFVVLMVGTLILLPGWPMDWLRQMLSYPEYTSRIGSTLSIIAARMPGIMQPVNIFLHGVFYLYLVFEWIRSRGKEINTFVWTAYMTLVITNLVAYRTATPHYVALLAPIFLVCKILEDRWGQAGKWVNRIVFFVLFVGLWALFLLTIKNTNESAVMYLPVPFLCLVFLWWSRWWSIKPMKSFFTENSG
jgi:hypothetical protein